MCIWCIIKTIKYICCLYEEHTNSCLPQMWETSSAVWFSKLRSIYTFMIFSSLQCCQHFSSFYCLLHISPSVNLPISLMATGGVVHVCVPSCTYKNAYTAKNYPERTQRIHSFFILVMWHSLMGESKKKLQWILFFFQPQRGMLQAHDTSSLPTVTMRNKSKKTSFPSASVMVSAVLNCSDN